MTNAESSTMEERKTSPTYSGRTFWFNDEGTPIHNTNGKSKGGRYRAVFTSPHLYYLMVVFLILGLYIWEIAGQRRLHSRPPLPSPDLKPLCGTTPEEALALGCVFDVYINAWIPVGCYDRAVAEQSESNSGDLFPLAGGRTTFPIYWDEEMTQRATLEDVSIAAFVNREEGYTVRFHIAYDYHRAHCLHMWRIAASAAERLSKGERNIGVYWKVASREHAWHCSKIIIDGDGRDPSKKDTITPGIGRCVGLDDAWNDSYEWAGRRKPN